MKLNRGPVIAFTTLTVALCFVSGYAVGQRQALKYEADFNSSANAFSVKLANANIENVRSWADSYKGVTLPEIGFDQKRRKFVAHALVTKALTDLSVDRAREAIAIRGMGVTRAVKFWFPEATDAEIEVLFIDATADGGAKDFAEYVNGKVVLK